MKRAMTGLVLLAVAASAARGWQEPEPLQVSLTDLAEMCFRNDAAVEELVEGKVLQVTGTVLQVSRQPRGYAPYDGRPVAPDDGQGEEVLYTVLMEAESNRWHSGASFSFDAAARKELAQLRPVRNQWVAIRGLCRGVRLSDGTTKDLLEFEFIDCKLIPIKLPMGPPALPPAQPAAPR
jgi:hypothetical protein